MGRRLNRAERHKLLDSDPIEDWYDENASFIDNYVVEDNHQNANYYNDQQHHADVGFFSFLTVLFWIVIGGGFAAYVFGGGCTPKRYKYRYPQMFKQPQYEKRIYFIPKRPLYTGTIYEYPGRMRGSTSEC